MMDGDVPIVETFIDLRAPQEQRDALIRSVSRDIIPAWSAVPDDALEISEISGGITNILLLVKLAEGGDGGAGADVQSVAVRIFGPNTEVVIDRKREWQALKLLSAAGFGAKLLGAFRNGVVQAYISARTLEPKDMSSPGIMALVARELHRFHRVQVPLPQEPQLWPTIRSFLKIARGLSFDGVEKQKKFAEVDFDELSGEIDQLQRSTDRLDAPVVFAHNDLLAGNLMLDDTTGKLHLIDFEYGAYGYRGYDIGNHFNEFAGFDCDYSRYPGKEAQYLFFRNYQHPSCPEAATEAELADLFVEANAYSLASHIYWAVWALVQAKHSPISFDYLGYFFLRMAEYRRRKAEVLPLLSARSQNRRAS